MIEVKHLTKRYGSHTAVSDLSFTVEKGQIYGFLGPNGAGKSTTMNIMTGCLAATSGEVVIGGYDIFQDAAQAKPAHRVSARAAAAVSGQDAPGIAVQVAQKITKEV